MFSDDALLATLPALKRSAKYFMRNGPDAEDLVQDTVAQALRYRSSFRENSNLDAWMQFIMRNLFRSTLRRQRWSGPMPEYWDGAAPDNPEDRIRLKELTPGLAALPDDRRYIVLRAALGDQISDIATHLGIPEGTVKSKMARGRQQLRETYQ